MSDHTVPQWKQRLKQAAVAAGIALAGYSTFTLPKADQAMHGFNGAQAKSSTLEAAVDRYNLGAKTAGWDLTVADIRSGRVDQFLDVKEPTEAGRLEAMNAFNNSFAFRVNEATENDLVRVARFGGASTADQDRLLATAAKFAEATTLGKVIDNMAGARNVISVKINDALQMIQGTDLESVRGKEMYEAKVAQLAARQDVERIQEQLKGQMSPHMASLFRLFDEEVRKGCVDPKRGVPLLDVFGDNLRDTGRKVVQTILASDEGKAALAQANKNETRDQFVARREQMSYASTNTLANTAPKKLADGMHRMLNIDGAGEPVRMAKKRSSPG